VAANRVSNADVRAQGTIFRYGIDGVCHQLANQVLYATGAGGAAPITVNKARGYFLSLMRYGTYGTPQAEARFWEKLGKCGRDRVRPPGGETMTTAPDEFEVHAGEVLGQSDPKLLADLLALRRNARGMAVGSRPTATSLNAQNQKLFDQAAELLGPAKFKAVFGFSPRSRVDLVDPSLMEAEKGHKAGKADSGRHSHRTPPLAPTVTLRHLAAALAASHEMSRKEAEAVLGDLVGNIVKHLKKGERIRIGGLGILQVRRRAARLGRNPATGEALKIKASKKVAFRAAKDLKEAI
jgi:DNA-binding protein HU-beta